MSSVSYFDLGNEIERRIADIAHVTAPGTEDAVYPSPDKWDHLQMAYKGVFDKCEKEKQASVVSAHCWSDSDKIGGTERKEQVEMQATTFLSLGVRAFPEDKAIVTAVSAAVNFMKDSQRKVRRLTSSQIVHL